MAFLEKDEFFFFLTEANARNVEMQTDVDT